MIIERREFLELASAAVAGVALSNVSPIHAQRPLPKSEYDYVDWSWEKWRKITGAVRPRVSGDQSGKAELIDLLMSGTEQITTPQAWQTRREKIRNLLRIFIGDSPKIETTVSRKNHGRNDARWLHSAETRFSNRTERICAVVFARSEKSTREDASHPLSTPDDPSR